MTDATRTTLWRKHATPRRRFLQTETSGALVLVAAAVAALIWINLDAHSYEQAWGTRLSLSVGDATVSLTLRQWINSGLMAFFFFVVGLEARREFDLGELREHRRVALPVIAGVAGMALAVGVFLVFNAGRPAAHAWGTAMSTDTALALGILALVGRGLPSQLRVFLLTVTVVDDLVALLVIATAYSSEINLLALLIGLGIFLVVLLVRAARIRRGLVYFSLAIACWFAVLQSGVDPIVVGLLMGLITYAYPAARGGLERATDLFRQFREQPTAQLAREARVGVSAAISPNDRLQQAYHPWTSYLVVPLFAVANAGVAINAAALWRAFTSPITLGILVGYVVGKPVAITAVAWLVTLGSRGRVRPPVGWASVVAGGVVSGMGFTVSLLIANIALGGEQLEDAKIGILSSALAASMLTWAGARVTAALPRPVRARALYGTANMIQDLAVPVDPERDHIRGPLESPVTVVEYGDFECPYCGQAEPVVRALLADFADVRYVWRHLPLTDVHPHAQLAAVAAEAADRQGAFWPLHDLLFAHQDALEVSDLVGYAEQLGLDTDRFREDLEEAGTAGRVAADVESADLSTVSGTPTFFINGRRHYAAYDLASLTAAVRTAKIEAGIRQNPRRFRQDPRRS